MDGVEVDSTPSLRHLEKNISKKSKARYRINGPVGVAVAAVLTGTRIWVFYFILFFGAKMATARLRSALDKGLGRCDAGVLWAWVIRWRDTRRRTRAVAMCMRHDVVEGVWFWRVL
jgi:hypothetical protein